MYASIRYIQTHHSYATILSQPDQNPHARNVPTSIPTSAWLPPEGGTNGSSGRATSPAVEAVSQPQLDAQNGPEDSSGLRPDPPHIFEEALKELAQDLVVKEQQIEYLIDALPGIGKSEVEQVNRIRDLESQLREVETRRQEAVKEKQRCIERLDGVIGRVRRI